MYILIVEKQKKEGPEYRSKEVGEKPAVLGLVVLSCEAWESPVRRKVSYTLARRLQLKEGALVQGHSTNKEWSPPSSCMC